MLFLTQARKRRHSPSPGAPQSSPTHTRPTKKLRAIPRPPPVPLAHREQLAKTALFQRHSSSLSALAARRQRAAALAAMFRGTRNSAGEPASSTDAPVPLAPVAPLNVHSSPAADSTRATPIPEPGLPDETVIDLTTSPPDRTPAPSPTPPVRGKASSRSASAARGSSFKPPPRSASATAATSTARKLPERSARSQDPAGTKDSPKRPRRPKHARVNPKKVLETFQKDWKARLAALPSSFQGSGPPPPLNARQVNALRLEQDVPVSSSRVSFTRSDPACSSRPAPAPNAWSKASPPASFRITRRRASPAPGVMPPVLPVRLWRPRKSARGFPRATIASVRAPWKVRLVYFHFIFNF